MKSFGCRVEKEITSLNQDNTKEFDETDGRWFSKSRLNYFCIIYGDSNQKSFHHIFGHPLIQSILYADKEFFILDTYSLAMTYCYFQRCKLSQQQYTPINFLAAMHLVLDMEEDSNHGRSIILKILKSKPHASPAIIRDLNRIKLYIWKEMGYRAIVSNNTCKQIIETMPDHPVWRRWRARCSYPTERLNLETKHRLDECIKSYLSET